MAQLVWAALSGRSLGGGTQRRALLRAVPARREARIGTTPSRRPRRTDCASRRECLQATAGSHPRMTARTPACQDEQFCHGLHSGTASCAASARQLVEKWCATARRAEKIARPCAGARMCSKCSSRAPARQFSALSQPAAASALAHLAGGSSRDLSYCAQPMGDISTASGATGIASPAHERLAVPAGPDT
jgi:hypothetical protein